MKSVIHITEDTLTRQEKLLIWLRRNKKTGRDLARFAGVEPITASRWLRADKIRMSCVHILRAYGIPEDLLPVASDGSHGAVGRA